MKTFLQILIMAIIVFTISCAVYQIPWIAKIRKGPNRTHPGTLAVVGLGGAVCGVIVFAIIRKLTGE